MLAQPCHHLNRRWLAQSRWDVEVVPEKFWGHDLVDSIAEVQTVDVFMGMHGAGFVNSFYLQPVRAARPPAMPTCSPYWYLYHACRCPRLGCISNAWLPPSLMTGEVLANDNSLCVIHERAWQLPRHVPDTMPQS